MRRSSVRSFVGIAGLVGLAAGGWGCAEDFDRELPPAGQAVAVYDPSKPAIPFPNDLLLDPATGLVKLPIDEADVDVDGDPPDSPAAQEFLRVLNTLDGFVPNSSVSTTFSAPLDPATVTPANVLVLDLTDPAADTSFVARALDAAGTTLTLTADPQFVRGHRYAVVLRAGADGLKAAGGGAVVGDVLFAFLKAPESLIDARGHAKSLSLGDALRKQVEAGGLSGEEAAAAAAAQLEGLEAIRQGNVLLLAQLQQAGLLASADDVPQMWTFQIHTRTSLVFDPVTARIPFPNDFLLDQTTKKVNLPPAADDAPEILRDTIAGLNTLDGFTTTGPLTVPLDGDLDQATLTPDNVGFFETPTFTAVDFTFEVKPGQLVLRPAAPLKPKTTYLVALSDRVKDLDGRAVAPFPVTVLLRSGFSLVDAAGKSLVPGVSDDNAVQLETGRQALMLAFAILNAKGYPREVVASFFPFTTQSTTDLLQDVRKTLRDQLAADGTFDDVSATFETLAQAQAAGRVPNPESSANIAFVATGTFKSQSFLDPATGAFGETPTEVDVPFVAYFPTTVSSQRIVLLHHGFEGWRHDMFGLGDRLAAAGIASLAIDAPLHGDRSVCAADSDCNGDVGCDAGTGQCSGGFKPDPGSTSGKPALSGQGYAITTNLFAIRDNLRQTAIDFFQATNVARATGSLSLAEAAAITGLNAATAEVMYVGQSQGGINGGVITAVEADITRGVLNVPGGSFAELALASPQFGPDVLDLFASAGILPDTPDFDLLLSTAIWVLEPGDNLNYANHSLVDPLDDRVAGARMAPRNLFVQQAGNDQVVPGPFTDRLVDVLAPDPDAVDGPGLVYKLYAGACHGFLTNTGAGADATCLGTAEGLDDMVDFLNGVDPLTYGAEVR